MEGKLQCLDHESLTQSPIKRKSDLVPAEEWEDERTPKQQKPDAPLEEDKKGCVDLNGNADKEKGKSIFPAPDDKGKGKMVVQESGSDDEGDSGDDKDGSRDGDDDDDYDDADFSDDPLTEIDVNNILPEKIRRRWTLVPRADLMAGNDEDDDDYNEDDDGDDDEAEEENEEDDEEMQEEIKRGGMAEE